MSLTQSLIVFVSMLFSSNTLSSDPLQKVKQEIKLELAAHPGVFAIAFKDMSSGETLFINEHETFHAASTMKTPVLLEAFKQAAAGKFALSDSIVIKNEFKSIVDGSSYSLDQGSDGDQEIYNFIGKKLTLYDLLYRMIIRSSNLATNMVIEMVGAENVTGTMRSIGAKNIQVRRGVEDGKAYEKGLNNTTTAYDLMLIFEHLAKTKTSDAEAMIKILLDQQFNEIIPAKLPKEVRVAHKTGSITGVQHDSGIVLLPDGRKYVLVILSKKLTNEKAAINAMANISERIYQHMVR